MNEIDITGIAYMYLGISGVGILIGLVLSEKILLKFIKLFTKTILKEQEYIRNYKLISLGTGIYLGIVSYFLFKSNDYRMILFTMPPVFFFLGLQQWNNGKHFIK